MSGFSRRIRSTCASRSAYLGYQISWRTITWVTGSASQEPANLDISSSLLWSTDHGLIWIGLTSPDCGRAADYSDFLMRPCPLLKDEDLWESLRRLASHLLQMEIARHPALLSALVKGSCLKLLVTTGHGVLATKEPGPIRASSPVVWVNQAMHRQTRRAPGSSTPYSLNSSLSRERRPRAQGRVREGTPGD